MTTVEKIRGYFLRAISLLLCFALLAIPLPRNGSAALSLRTFTIEQAQRMAISKSSAITKQNNQIVLKKMKYVEAVKGIKAKVKNLKSFRWSPLLSFKFPQQLKLPEDYELNIKPITLQTEIDNLTHRLKDLEYEITNSVNQVYFDVYYLQEKTTFTETRLDAAKLTLEKNKAKLKTGDATQTDVDRAESSVNTLTASLSNDLKAFESAKEKLSEMVGIDVTVGYKFTNCFKTASIPRDALDGLIGHTLDNDQAFYETKAAESTALLNVESYEGFMRSEYGKKMNVIQPYINMAKQGMDVDYAAFQMKYNEMLKALDKPWSGKIRILFFKFTMEWFKGEIDGTRYIEDEMYAVYTACMEYGNAKKDRDSMEKDLRSQTKDTYESVLTSHSAYTGMQEQVTLAETTHNKILALNKLGKATFEEVADEQEVYEEAQLAALDSLKEYNVILSEFDRLTCGAVSKYLKDTSTDLSAGESGDAYAMLDPINDAYYYIYTKVADLTFFFGISIPEDFSPEIDSFEIWYAGTQIGTRTAVGNEISHLALDYKDTGMLTVRLYNGDEFVDECEIDAAIPRDVLDIKEAKTAPAERSVGTYEISTVIEGGVSVSELKLKINSAEGADSYTLSYGDGGIYSTDKRPVKEVFSYLTLIATSLDEVVGTLYDRDGNKMYDFRFDTTTQEILTDNTEQ